VTDLGPGTSGLVEYGVADGVATVTLNRPDKLNALTPPMIADVDALLARARDDAAVRCVVVAGAGRAFCAGDDISVRRVPAPTPDLDAVRRWNTSYLRVVRSLLELRLPTIAAVQGPALGAGMDLALCCDLRIAATDARLGTPVITHGLGGAGMYLLCQYLGFGRATELMISGSALPAATAYELGMLTAVVEPEQLAATAGEYATRYASAPTGSIGALKVARNRVLGVVDGLAAQLQANMELQFFADPIEGRTAWADKRPPRFTGRYRPFG
jgi:2-(1,2-epoxy-1,2-dihydrophenyl)acetyl-CoA isomerase